MIVLDTNIIEPYKTLSGPGVDLLLAVARITGQPVYVPEMVVEEFTAHRRHDLQGLVDAVASASAKLAEKVPGWKPADLPDVEGSLPAFRERLHELGFGILPYSDGHAIEAMRREANRLAPASRRWADDKGEYVPGSGARDVMVWLAALEVAKTIKDTVYLVSEDRRAFREGKTLLPELAAEVEREAGKDKLVLFAGVEAMLEGLAPKQKVTGITVKDAAEHELVWVAVDERFRGAAAEAWGVLSATAGSGERLAYFANHTEPLLIGTRSALMAYRVEDTTWASFRAAWETTVTFVAEQGTSYFWKIQSELTILAQLNDDENDIVWAEVLDSRPLVLIEPTERPNIMTIGH